MIANYEEHGFKVTAEILPERCTECPFWGLDTKTLTSGICIISGTEIEANGFQDERRMDDCPIEKEG